MVWACGSTEQTWGLVTPGRCWVHVELCVLFPQARMLVEIFGPAHRTAVPLQKELLPLINSVKLVEFSAAQKSPLSLARLGSFAQMTWTVLSLLKRRF